MKTILLDLMKALVMLIWGAALILAGILLMSLLACGDDHFTTIVPALRDDIPKKCLLVPNTTVHLLHWRNPEPAPAPTVR